MRIASLVIGILIMILSAIAFVVCLALPAMTDNRVSSQEAMLGLIPSVIVLFLGFLWTVIAVIFVIKGKKAKA
jgi:hypothetical protein